MGFSRQGYWSGLLFPSPRDLPNPGIEPGYPALQADSLPTELHRHLTLQLKILRKIQMEDESPLMASLRITEHHFPCTYSFKSPSRFKGKEHRHWHSKEKASKLHYKKNMWAFLVIQSLRLPALSTGGPGSILVKELDPT